MKPLRGWRILALGLAVSCGNGESTSTVPHAPRLILDISPWFAALTAGQTLQLSEVPGDFIEEAQIHGPTIWRSLDESIATVSSSGLVTAVGIGSTTILATSDGKTTPVTIGVLRDAFIALAQGSSVTCGLTGAGAAYCWGYGALGAGMPSTWGYAPPTKVVGEHVFRELAAGAQHTCALTTSGKAFCWGSNHYGGLGAGTTETKYAPVAVDVDLVFAALSAGFEDTCGLTAAGAAYCWGLNTYGELGRGVEWRPVGGQGGMTFTALALGAFHSCGLTDDGSAYCWGLNRNGQLGDSTTTERRTPVAVRSQGLSFATLRAGAQHTCGLTSAGRAYCWGANASGSLGDRTRVDRLVPTPVAGDFAFGALFTGVESAATCGLTTAGAAYCWGASEYDMFGIPNMVRPSPAPTQKGFVFKRLAVGMYYFCGLVDTGATICWGTNAYDLWRDVPKGVSISAR
jgi:alpha-tubulin suppressor-like RCC1 family protein